MSAPEEEFSQNNEDQIEEELPESQNQGTETKSKKKQRKKLDSKKKKIAKKQELKKPIDGKQQFGDKAICRLCKVTTQNQATIICNRCHFKYHPECIASQDKEPIIVEGEKWMCASCIIRVEKRKLKETQPQKKKKANQIQDYFAKSKPLQEDKAKKLLEFQQRYPSYVHQGRVAFPILDEYLTAYQGLFGVEHKKKPTPTEDTEIPQDAFEDVLVIWDSYNNMEKIVSDILYLGESGIDSQSQITNIGTLFHFKDNHQPYTQKSREKIYLEMSYKPKQLILFFSYFYLKQLIEDIDAEAMQKQQYKTPFWHLLGYLWLTNRNKYYQLIEKEINLLPLNICKQGILKLSDELIEKLESNKVIKPIHCRKILVSMVEGLAELKKTQYILQFRTENLLSNNRMKVQLGQEVKTLRNELTEKSKEATEAEVDYQQVKSTLITNNDLGRQETSKLTRQMETSQKAAQKGRSSIVKLEREINSLTERYNQLEQELQITQIPPLLLNPSMFLGYDSKNCQYYFFLYEADKIFVCWKDTFLDDQKEMNWGYYGIEDLTNLMDTLCVKGVRENQLKNNVQDLIRAKLLQSEQSIQVENNHTDEMEREQEDKEEAEEAEVELEDEHIGENGNGNGIIEDNNEFSEQLDITIQDLNKEFLEIELSLTQYLNQKQSRWCSSDTRNAFRKSFEQSTDDITPLCKAIEFFVENTMMQEKLELRPEEENEEKNNDQEEDSPLQQNLARKRKVVEDDSSAEEQTFLQQLEQMDNNKVRVRKLPMKLFGTYYETLRLNLIEQVKQNDENITKMKVVLEVLGQIVKDYIERKKVQQAIQLPEKKKIEEPLIQKKEKPPQYVEQPAIVEQRFKMTQNLRIRSKTKPQYVEFENRWEDLCKLCGTGGKVICCDTCPSVFHPKCLGLKEVPQGKWNCLKCLSNFERQVKTRATIRKLENQ